MEEKGMWQHAFKIREDGRKRRDEEREAQKTRWEDERHRNDKFMQSLMVMVTKNGNWNMPV